MRRRTIHCLGVFIAASLFVAAGARGVARPQNHSAAKDGTPTVGQQKAAPKAPSSTPSSGTPESSSRSQAKSSSEAKGKSPSESGHSTPSNAFPLAQSEAAARTQREKENASGVPAQTPQTSYPGPYSSSSTGLSPSALGEGAPPVGRKQSGGMDTFTRDHTLDGRIADDLNVADLYMKNGNYRGALWRYQDALHYAPKNDTALYGVAEAMCKQNRTADAMAHSKSYLESYPQGKYAKKAESMLSDPNRCRHNR